MALRVYNTLTKQKELFEPVTPGKVRMYLCGPTVYKSPHIGHMVGPVIFDAVKRYLQFKGYEVTWVVNITDVDDKLIDAANRLGTTVQELSDRHTREYFEALAALGVSSIDQFPRATAHMADIIELCQGLVERGYAYSAAGNVWFDVNKDPDYGKLSHRHVEEQESGGRETVAAGKRNPADFALWKAAKPGEPAWDSPWGRGRPGWHIECSAMSLKTLKVETLDIHGGGMDLMFPHHENELAQSESATGKPFVKYWMHNGLTKVRTKAAGGEWQAVDMHESSGNAIRVRQLVEQHGPEVIRYLLLSSHYRRPIEFSEQAIADVKKALATFHRLFERLERMTPPVPTNVTAPLGATAAPSTQPAPPPQDMDRVAATLLDGEHAAFAKSVLAGKMKFLEMMDDDFNTAGGIGTMHELAGEINAFIERNDVERKKQPELVTAVAAAGQTLKNLGGILGLFTHKPAAMAGQQTESKLPDQLMTLLIRLRNEARKSKNFALADDIRKGLAEIGVTLEDRADGTGWRKD
jgi:cysteinyl-tRNA synthetase